MKKKDGTQLCTLLSTLGASVESQDDLGMLVGYSVMSALINFESSSGSEEERRFEEVKSVYRVLEKTISQCMTNDTFYALSELMEKVEPELPEIFEIPTADLSEEKLSGFESTLLRTMIKNVSFRGGYRDKLRRVGSRLFSETAASSPSKGTRNILTKDYERIEQYVMKG